MMSMSSLTPLKATGAVSYRTTSASGEETTTLTLNGIEIPLRETRETLFAEISTLYKKGDRKDLDKKDRLALITAATEKKEVTYFTPLALTVDDESKLDDCYNIGTKIEKVEARHRLYDMHDVFTIVVPTSDGKTLKEEAYNLYTEYANVTADSMVAASNKWYNSWPAGPTWQENLNWTHQFFESNVAQELAEKVNEVYMLYPRESRGGPLYFILLMNQLLSQTEEAVLALQARLKKLDLKNIPGENVDKAISLARAAIIRLETFNKTPEDLVRNLLKTFQTTSVPSFNEIFKHMEKQRLLSQALGGVTASEQLTATGIFRVASSQYRLLWEEGSWTGIRTKGEAVFNASTGKGCCWNCGDPNHQLPECKLPKDNSKISANRLAHRKAAREAKHDKGGKGPSDNGPATKTTTAGPTSGSGKWKAPTPSEKNRRVIDNKAMWWNKKMRRWVPDTKAPGANAATTMSTSVGANSTPDATTLPPPAPTQQVPSPGNSLALAAARQAYAAAYATALQQLGTV